MGGNSNQSSYSPNPSPVAASAATTTTTTTTTSSSHSTSNPPSPRHTVNLCERNNTLRVRDTLTEMKRQVSDASFVRRKPTVNEAPRKRSFIGMKSIEKEGITVRSSSRELHPDVTSERKATQNMRNGFGHQHSEAGRPRTSGETEKDQVSFRATSALTPSDVSLRRFTSPPRKGGELDNPSPRHSSPHHQYSPRRSSPLKGEPRTQKTAKKSVAIYFVDESSVQVMIDDAMTAADLIPHLPHPKISIRSSEFALFEVDNFSERRIANSERLVQTLHKWEYLDYPRKFIFKEIAGTICFHFADGSQETMEISLSSICKDVIKHAIGMRGLKGGVSDWKVILSYGEKEIDIEEMEKLLELQELMEFNKSKFAGAKFWIKENSSMGTIRVRLEDGTFKTLSVTSLMTTTDVVKLLEKKLHLSPPHSFSLYEVDYTLVQEHKMQFEKKPLLRQIEWREKTKNMKDYVNFCFHSPSFSPFSASPSPSPSLSSNSFSSTTPSISPAVARVEVSEERRKKKTFSKVMPSLHTSNVCPPGSPSPRSPTTGAFSSSSSSSSSPSPSSSTSSTALSPRGTNRPAAFTQGDVSRKVVPSWFKK